MKAVPLRLPISVHHAAPIVESEAQGRLQQQLQERLQSLPGSSAVAVVREIWTEADALDAQLRAMQSHPHTQGDCNIGSSAGHAAMQPSGPQPISFSDPATEQLRI